MYTPDFQIEFQKMQINKITYVNKSKLIIIVFCACLFKILRYGSRKYSYRTRTDLFVSVLFWIRKIELELIIKTGYWKWSEHRFSTPKFSKSECYSFEYTDVVLCTSVFIIHFPIKFRLFLFECCACVSTQKSADRNCPSKKTQMEVNKLTLSIAKTFIAAVSIYQNIRHLLSTKAIQSHIQHSGLSSSLSDVGRDTIP